MQTALSLSTLQLLLIVSLALLASCTSVGAVVDDIDATSVPKPDDAIVIIGAGASGIHMAYALSQRGYRNITLLERNDYIGGKVRAGATNAGSAADKRTYDLSQIDTGALLLTAGYRTLLPIIMKFNLTLERSNAEQSPVGLARWKSPLVDGIRSEQSESPAFDYERSFMLMLRAFAKADVSVPDDAVMGRLQVCLQRYTDDWMTLYAPYVQAGLRTPLRIPTDVLQRSFAGKADDYFEEIGCPELGVMVAIANTLYGYGSDEMITKFYLFSLLTPGYFNLFFNRGCPPQAPLGVCNFGDHGNDTVVNPFFRIKEGFHTVFRKMAEESGASFETGVRVMRVTRTAAGTPQSHPIKVKYRKGGAEYVKHFDFLIISGNPAGAVSTYLADAMPEERRVFATRKKSSIVSTLLSARSRYVNTPEANGTPKLHSPTLLFLDEIVALYAPANTGPATALVDYTKFVPGFTDDSHKKFFVSYQTIRNVDVDSEDWTRLDAERLRKDALRTLQNQLEPLGFSRITPYQQQAFSYNPRLTQDEVQAGTLWDIIDLQGRADTWYIGAYCTFESVESVTNYNMMLLNKFGI
eukprot:jgi/Mesvir1/28195/Mv04749-RA.1